MKKTILSAAFLLFAFAISAQSPFNGTWKINKDKSNVPTDQLYLSQISVMVRGDSLLTTRTYSDPNGQEYPFDENMTFDGKEAKINIYDMPRVSKAQKGPDGTIIIDSRTTFNGGGGEDSLVAKESWKSDGNSLSIDQTIQMSGQEFKGIFVYDKVK
ncbi:MAG: hypothetical protein ACM3UT_03015 [Chloroflexota bacterium]